MLLQSHWHFEQPQWVNTELVPLSSAKRNDDHIAGTTDKSGDIDGGFKSSSGSGGSSGSDRDADNSGCGGVGSGGSSGSGQHSSTNCSPPHGWLLESLAPLLLLKTQQQQNRGSDAEKDKEEKHTGGGRIRRRDGSKKSEKDEDDNHGWRTLIEVDTLPALPANQVWCLLGVFCCWVQIISGDLTLYLRLIFRFTFQSSFNT